MVSDIYMPFVAGPRPNLKKGACVTGAVREVLTVNGCWGYSWCLKPRTLSGVEMLPMAWTADAARMDPPAGGNSAWLMGFNEPDRASQSNMTPLSGAIGWRQLESLYPERLLLAPCPSHLGGSWIDEFYAAYLSRYKRPPRLNALACHTYLRTAEESFAVVAGYIERAQRWGIGGGVWLTEFNFTVNQCGSLDGALEQADLYLAMLDAAAGVTRYAWFSTHQSLSEPWTGNDPDNLAPLFDDLGQLTAYGGLYRDGHLP